jgi:hypothetical protein
MIGLLIGAACGFACWCIAIISVLVDSRTARSVMKNTDVVATFLLLILFVLIGAAFGVLVEVATMADLLSKRNEL